MAGNGGGGVGQRGNQIVMKPHAQGHKRGEQCSVAMVRNNVLRQHLSHRHTVRLCKRLRLPQPVSSWFAVRIVPQVQYVCCGCVGR